jgi:uncharacterized membrane protein YkvA (DUF1232 family)
MDSKIVDGVRPETVPTVASLKSSDVISWKEKAQRIQKEAHTLYFALKHPRVPWYAKLVAACAVAYLFSPIQLIPSYIPVIGFLDDFLVLSLGIKLLRRIIPADVLAECRALADSAELQKKDQIRTVAGTIGFIVIIIVWLAIAIVGSYLVAKHFAR